MRKYERGAVSIFIVVFASLLITIVTVSFLRIMTQTTREASVVDLSQSAYDAALDGVEDAKRAIASGNTIDSSDGCTQVAQALGKGDNEVVIEQKENAGDTSDAALSMAYTCVTVDFTAKSIEEDNVTENSSIIIPLRTQRGNDFEKVRIGWKRQGETYTPATPYRTSSSLPQKGSWDDTDGDGTSNGNVPPLLRVRYIWADADIDLDDYNSVELEDSSDPDYGKFKRASNSRTKFLIPGSGAAVLTSSSIATTAQNDSDPTLVNCIDAHSGTSANMQPYDCIFTLNNVPAGSNNRALKFIQLTPLYKGADVSVELIDGDDNIVPFSGVQAVVDSTGRAGDVFRRVQARVRLDGADTTTTYPSDALVVGGGDLCKDFYVTNDTDDYAKNALCP